MAKDKRIEKCPWCHRLGAHISGLNGAGYYVGCWDKCEATGPNRKTRWGAIAAWNRVSGLVHKGTK